MKNQEPTLTDEQIEDIAKNKETAAASYTLLFAPILLTTRRDSTFIAFHAKQGLVLGLLFLLLWWLGGYASVFRYATIFILFAAVIGFLQALAGKQYAIPGISTVVKNGLSPSKIIKSIRNIFFFLGKIFKGTMPKKAEEGIEEKTVPTHTKVLEKRVERLEKMVEELQKGK